MERPVLNHTHTLDVRLRLYLQQIVDVDEKNQVLTLVLWEEFKWQDYKMRWDPREYGNIERMKENLGKLREICHLGIRLPSDALWKPDVLLFNRFLGNNWKSFIFNVFLVKLQFPFYRIFSLINLVSFDSSWIARSNDTRIFMICWF